MCVCVKCPLTCLWSWMFFSLEMWEFWFFFRRSSIWSLMLFTCGTKQKGSHEDLGEAHSVDSRPLKYTLVLYHCLTSDGEGSKMHGDGVSPPETLTLVLQAALPVGFDLHLAQVLAVLVLQQRSLPLQLPQRGLHLLPAAHLEEPNTESVRGRSPGGRA